MSNRLRFVTVLAACVCLRTGSAHSLVTPAAAARFLGQARFGPTAATATQVQQMGISGWIDSQFGAPITPIPDVPPDANGREPVAPVQQQFFVNTLTGSDQLRQRVALALSEIWVVSAVKLTTADQIVPYLRLLQQDAFSNYSKIMADVTLSPSMGHYLDMVNNDKPSAGREANENYARELLQLFTIGVNELNDDGTQTISTSGQPIPTYDQSVVQGFARVFTGWTYAPMPGVTPRNHNPAYFAAPMVAVESLHDTGSKTLLDGFTLPGGASRTAEQDLADALGNVFQHHNVAPFISRQLIQHLVTSSPSPAYVSRVVAAWRASAGDMKTVIKAILLDQEARSGDSGTSSPAFGHLREPVLFISTLLRQLGASAVVPNSLPSQGNNMGQNIYYSPSVFNYFSPGYRFTSNVPGQVPASVNAPEFQIQSTSTTLVRTNFLNTLIYGTVSGVTLDFTPYLTLTPPTLLDTLNEQLMDGTMSAAMRTSILKAVNAQTTAKARAQTAIYLIAASSQYQIAR
jgi:uncharacterized protein (DUF1800 family)